MDLKDLDWPYVAVELVLEYCTSAKWDSFELLLSAMANFHLTNLLLFHFYDLAHESLLSYTISLWVFNTACVFMYSTLQQCTGLSLNSICLELFQLNMHVSKMKIVYLQKLHNTLHECPRQEITHFKIPEVMCLLSILLVQHHWQLIVPAVLLVQVFLMYHLKEEAFDLLLAVEMLVVTRMSDPELMSISTLLCIALLHHSVDSDTTMATSIFLCEINTFKEVIFREKSIEANLERQRAIETKIDILLQQSNEEQAKGNNGSEKSARRRVRQLLTEAYRLFFQYPDRIPRTLAENELIFIFELLAPVEISEMERRLQSVGTLAERYTGPNKSSELGSGVKFIILDSLIIIHGVQNCKCRVFRLKGDFTAISRQIMTQLQYKTEEPENQLLIAIFKRVGITAIISPDIAIIYVPIMRSY